jgi:hypothetical protein
MADVKCLHKTVGEVMANLRTLLPATKPKAKAGSKRKQAEHGEAAAVEGNAAQPGGRRVRGKTPQ